MQRTRRPKVALPGGKVVDSNAKFGQRQIRCPRCHNLAGPARTSTGKPVIRCHSCGAQFTTTAM